MIPAREGAAPLRILVVDDSRALRMILARAVRELGCEVFEAADGVDALEHLKRLHGVDLILSDVNMPGMDGFELARAVRADPELAPVPILMVTANHDAVEVERARAAGASGYLPKPFTTDMLRERFASLGLLPGLEKGA